MAADGASLPTAISEITVFEPTWCHISVSQPTKRGKSGERYYYSDLSILLLRCVDSDAIADGGCFSASVEDLRLAGPARVSHFDVLLAPGQYLIVPCSLERQMAVEEQLLHGSFQSVGLAGMKKGKGSSSVSYCIRLLSAHVVQVRQVSGMESDVVWDSIERAVCDAGLLKRKVVGSPAIVMERTLCDGVSLRLLEAGGIALIHVTNTLSTKIALIRFKLSAATKTYSATNPEVWRAVLPLSRRLVGLCVCPAFESMAEYYLVTADGIECKVVENLQGERCPPNEGLFATRRISFQSS